MSPSQIASSLACPRCRSATVRVLSEAPVAGAWAVYGCKTCFYAWRSTEAAENTQPDSYPAAFRLRPEDLAKFPIVPTIPPLRKR